MCIFHRILVLDKGEIREFDSPDTLMKDKDSVFASLARDAGLLCKGEMLGTCGQLEKA